MLTFSSIIVYIWLAVMFLVALYLWLSDGHPGGVFGLVASYLAVMVIAIVIGLIALVALLLVAFAVTVFIAFALFAAYPVVHFIISIIPF